MELLAQLSFSESIAQDIFSNKDLIKTLQDLSNKASLNTTNANENEVNQNIKTLVSQINWNINEKNAKNIGSNLVERCQCLFLIRVCFLGMHDTLKKIQMSRI